MKRKTKTYFRVFYISFVIIMCLMFGWIGIATAYEKTVQTAYGEYRNAVGISNGKFRILDFVIN